LTIAVFFPHPITGSLGSFRRVEEIATSLCSRLKTKINIYTPYERKSRVLSESVTVSQIPGYFSTLGLENVSYRLSKYVYYNRALSRKLLIRSLGFSKSLLYENMVKLLSKDEVKAVQAEQDVSLPLALKLGEELDLPVVADLHNISAEELVAIGVLERNDKVYSDLQHQIGECLLGVDAVCVVSETMRDYVGSTYDVPSNRILLVPPGGRPRCETVTPGREGNKVVFSGTVSYREHVDLFVRSLPLVKESVSKAEFYATRKGEDLDRIMRLCRTLKIDMRWVWFSDEKDLFRFLCECAVGVLPSSSDRARVMGTPIKLFDYMSVGLPVVANRVDGWSELIEHENVGILTRDEPKDFAQGILGLLQDEDLRAKCANNALEAVREKYNWDRLVEPLAKLYENLA
jgi:glycosyltransferase involved in cell wall biosynthesis